MRYLVLGVDRDDCGFDPPSLGMFNVEAPSSQRARDAAEKRDKNFLCVECLDATRLRELADQLEGQRHIRIVRDSRRGREQHLCVDPPPRKGVEGRQR